jgi:IS605 OrfB family transposase
MTYDERILSFKDCDQVSILILSGGRQLIPFVYGQHQAARLERLQGQVDLVYRDGQLYLYATIDLPEEPALAVHDFVEVDLGICNLATTSDGETFVGEEVERVRQRFRKTRRNLQSRGTRSAKRILKRIGRRESRYRRHQNHVISKKIVAAAKDTSRGIALEELKGIRTRCTVRRRQRSRFHGWSFNQLRQFLTYKARLAGVPVVTVDPRNSSRTCSACGHCEKANRSDQATFRCQHCGHSEHADINAARNLASRARAVCNPASLAADLRV